MSKFRMGIFAALLALAAGLGSLAHGESGSTGYPSHGVVALGTFADRQTAAFMSGVSSAHATAVATLTSTTTNRIALLGKPNVSVGARFVDTSKTAVVYLLLSYVDPDSGTEYVKGCTAGKTCTGGTTTDAGGLFMAPDIYFTLNAGELAGATHARLVMSTGPTTKTVSFWTGTY